MLFESYYEDLFKPLEVALKDWWAPFEECGEKENEDKKTCCSDESKHCAEDGCHSWCQKKEETKVNGEVTYRSDKQWKDGELVKNEVYDPGKAIGEAKCEKKKPCNRKHRKDDSVRIDVERYEHLVDIEKHYEDRLNTLEAIIKRTRAENERLKNKLEKLQDTFKTLCED